MDAQHRNLYLLCALILVGISAALTLSIGIWNILPQRDIPFPIIWGDEGKVATIQIPLKKFVVIPSFFMVLISFLGCLDGFSQDKSVGDFFEQYVVSSALCLSLCLFSVIFLSQSFNDSESSNVEIWPSLVKNWRSLLEDLEKIPVIWRILAVLALLVIGLVAGAFIVLYLSIMLLMFLGAIFIELYIPSVILMFISYGGTYSLCRSLRRILGIKELKYMDITQIKNAIEDSMKNSAIKERKKRERQQQVKRERLQVVSGHVFSSNGICIRCGCSESSVEKFGWKCD